MSVLGEIVANSLWFAFDELDYQKTGVVAKSQLKVLTQNVGVLLGVKRRVENCIADYLSVGGLNFDQFLYFLTHEVLAEVDDGNTPYGDLKKYHDLLEETFWLLGRQSIFERHVPVFNDDSVFKLFRTFCLLADRTPTKDGISQVTISSGEVNEVARALVLGIGRDWDQQDYEQLALMIPSFPFSIFLTFLEGRYTSDVEGPALAQSVGLLYDTFVEQVLIRGKMYQRLTWAPMWITRDIEVVPWAVREYREGRHYAGKVLGGPPIFPLTKSTNCFPIPDEDDRKTCRLAVRISKYKSLLLAAPDHRTKAQWIQAISVALEHCQEPLPYQMLVSAERKAERALEEEKETQEKIRRASQADIIEQTQAELVAERMARAEAEAAAKEEAAAREAEGKRVKELQLLKQRLETLLEEETQAKRDEEIVRNLQARVLREEWEKREELEKLQEEQRKILEEEKKKRQAFEKLQDEKEQKLKIAQQKLKKLEADRLRLDWELRTAREKIVMSERGKEILEAQMKVKERVPPVRTYSLRPCRRDKGGYIPTRSSSFNTHTVRPRRVVQRQNDDQPPSLPPPTPPLLEEDKSASIEEENINLEDDVAKPVEYTEL